MTVILIAGQAGTDVGYGDDGVIPEQACNDGYYVIHNQACNDGYYVIPDLIGDLKDNFN